MGTQFALEPTEVKTVRFAEVFYGLSVDDIPNLNLLVNAAPSDAEDFGAVDNTSSEAAREIRKLNQALIKIAGNLNAEIITCELSLIADSRQFGRHDKGFFSTYLWSNVNGPEFLGAYNRAMNNMTRAHLGEAPIVTHPEFVSRDIAFVDVMPTAPEFVFKPIEFGGPANIYSRRYYLTSATRESSLKERVEQFRNELVAAMADINGESGRNLSELFNQCRMLVVPLFRQSDPSDLAAEKISARGEHAGVFFVFFRSDRRGDRDALNVEFGLTERLSWLFGEGFNREAQAVFGRVAEQRDVLYNMIHTTVNALSAMNMQNLDALLIDPGGKNRRTGNIGKPSLRHRLILKRSGRELDEAEEESLIGIVRSAHHLQRMSAALLSISEMSFHPGRIRPKFQASSETSVVRLLNECLAGANNINSASFIGKPKVAISFVPSLVDVGVSPAAANYENLYFSPHYVHHAVIQQIVFEILGNARQFGEEIDGTVHVKLELRLNRDGGFLMQFRNERSKHAGDFSQALTGLSGLNLSFLQRANSFLEAARLGGLSVSLKKDQDYEINLQLRPVTAETASAQEKERVVPPVTVRAIGRGIDGDDSIQTASFAA